MLPIAPDLASAARFASPHGGGSAFRRRACVVLGLVRALVLRRLESVKHFDRGWRD